MYDLYSKGKVSIGIVIITIIVLGSILAGAIHNAVFSPKVSLARQIMVCPTPDAGSKSLQLKPCYPITLTPEPTTPLPPGTAPYCSPDAAKAKSCDCTELLVLVCDACRSANLDPNQPLPRGCAYLPSDPSFFSRQSDPQCGLECIGKPVIYLYPTKTTLVDVSLSIPGIVTVSNPLYPEGGWKNVEAHPDGSLKYNGSTYKELYYETALTTKSPQPTQGIFIPKDTLEEQLTTITTQLGLLPIERQEFLDYWIPRLTALNTPYVFFSILDPQEKERVDHVAISPKPDTMIAFIAYFKGVQTPFAIQPLQLPLTPPERKGYTAVEWGGTIELQ